MATVMASRRRHFDSNKLEALMPDKRHDEVERTITRLDTVVDRLDSIYEVLAKGLEKDQDVTIKTESTSQVTKTQGADNDSGGFDSGGSANLPGSPRTSRRHKKRTSGT